MSKSRDQRRTVERNRKFLTVIVILLLLGGLHAAYMIHSAEQHRRSGLLQQAEAAAAAMNPSLLAALAQANPRQGLPEYQQLKRQLTCLASHIPSCKFVSIVEIRSGGDGDILIGSDDLDIDFVSHRDKLYEEIAAAEFKIHGERSYPPIRLFRDHGGSWLSAPALVIPSAASKPGFLLTMGFATGGRLRSSIGAATPSLLFTAAAIAILIGGHVYIARRSRRTAKQPQKIGHLQLALAVITVGFLLSLSLFWIVRSVDHHARDNAFWQLASERVEAIDRVLRTLVDVELEALARFYQASEYVTPKEFADYTPFLTHNAVIRSWQWVRPVAAAERDGIAAAFRAEGLADFTVWQRDAQGRQVAASGRDTLFAVARIAPRGDRGGELGFDHASDPRLAAALREAIRTGLPVATAPALPADGADRQNVFMVYRPVFAGNGPPALLGFAAAVLPLDTLLQNVLWNRAVELSITSLHLDKPPVDLATTQQERNDSTSRFVARQPVLAFGKTIMVTAHTGPEFAELYPARAAVLVLVAGLLLTAMLSLLYGMFYQKRAQLEGLVALRTAELNEAKQHMELAIRGADLGTWDWHVPTSDFIFNDRWHELLGYGPEELPRNVGAWPAIMEPAELAAVMRAVADLRTGVIEYYEAEHRLRHKDGHPIWVLVKGRLITHDDSGKPIRVCGTCVDITNRKLAEQERERLQDQIRHGQKMEAVGRLAGGIAHDLNNLLSPIIGYGQLLLDNVERSGETHNFADAILRAGLRARDLVRQLLAYGRKQALEVRPVNLNEIIKAFESLLRRTIPEDIEIRIFLATDTSMILADAGQIEQVLMNLAVNAAQAMPEGGKLTIETAMVELTEEYARTHPEVVPGFYLLLAVSDTGIGMDEATREHIFEPFFSTKGDMGTGMGLATVFGIVKQHGGSIWVYSEPGKGSTFKIYLPPMAEGPRSPAAASEAPTNLRGSETVLVVEDSEDVRSLTCSILARYGYKVLAAASGREALEIAGVHDGPIHLLLSDVVMPEMNGRELHQELAQRHPGLAVLFMSGYTDNVIAHHGILDADVHFIQKPFSIKSLAQRVRETIDS